SDQSVPQRQARGCGACGRFRSSPTASPSAASLSAWSAFPGGNDVDEDHAYVERRPRDDSLATDSDLCIERQSSRSDGGAIAAFCRESPFLSAAALLVNCEGSGRSAVDKRIPAPSRLPTAHRLLSPPNSD